MTEQEMKSTDWMKNNSSPFDNLLGKDKTSFAAEDDSEFDEFEDEKEISSLDEKMDEDDEEDEDVEESEEDTEEEEEEVDDDEEEYEEEDEEDTPSELESTLCTSVFNETANRFGLTLKKGEKITDIEELADAIEDLVSKKSEPAYHSELTKELDEFLGNGGSFEEFYQTFFAQKDYENIVLNTRAEKEQVLRDYLTKLEPNRSKESINKSIRRINDDEIDEETGEALEYLIENSKKQKVELLQSQKAEIAQQEKARKEWEGNMKNMILSANNIAGFDVNERTRKDFVKYYLEPNPKTGLTQHETYVRSNPEVYMHLPFVAFMMSQGKSIVQEAKDSGLKEVKKRIRTLTSGGNDTYSREREATRNSKQSKSQNATNEAENFMSVFGGMKSR